MAVNMPKLFVSPGTSYAKEFEKVKELLHAGCRVNVYELLTKDVKGVATNAVKMEILARTVKAKDFHEEYPNLGSIVKYKYKKALDQRKLLESSECVIIKCLGKYLPQVCAKIIISYLSDHDLKNLIEAAEWMLDDETT